MCFDHIVLHNRFCIQIHWPGLVRKRSKYPKSSGSSKALHHELPESIFCTFSAQIVNSRQLGSIRWSGAVVVAPSGQLVAGVLRSAGALKHCEHELCSMARVRYHAAAWCPRANNIGREIWAQQHEAKLGDVCSAQ